LGGSYLKADAAKPRRLNYQRSKPSAKETAQPEGLEPSAKETAQPEGLDHIIIETETQTNIFTEIEKYDDDYDCYSFSQKKTICLNLWDI